MEVWTYICENCGWEDTFAENEPFQECQECGEVAWNTDDPHEE